MREITTKEYKKIATELLDDFDKVCRVHNIRYSIAYGTLLGAVRHKGFIPWDDDIDVIIPRADYYKLLEVRDELKENHQIVSIETNKKFTAPLAKLIDTYTILRQIGHAAEKIDLGVYVDIFVYDFIPENKDKTNLIYKTCNFMQKAWGFCEYEPNDKYPRIVNFFRGIANRSGLARKVAIIMDQYAKSRCKRSNYYSCLMYGYKNRKIYIVPQNEFNDLCDYTFEGVKVKGLSDYDKYLSCWYGDYMKLPPIEERVSGHSFEVYHK